MEAPLKDLKKSDCGLYVTYDKVADDYSPVFQAINDAVAIRQFSSLMSQAYSPKDYTLYKVGDIDGADIRGHVKQLIYDGGSFTNE